MIKLERIERPEALQPSCSAGAKIEHPLRCATSVFSVSLRGCFFRKLFNHKDTEDTKGWSPGLSAHSPLRESGLNVFWNAETIFYGCALLMPFLNDMHNSANLSAAAGSLRASKVIRSSR